MHVQIDEPGRNDETGDSECLACGERLHRDRRNPAALDAHVARRVQACFGVEYAAACEDEIVLLVAGSDLARREGDHGEEDHQEGVSHEPMHGGLSCREGPPTWANRHDLTTENYSCKSTPVDQP